MSKPTGLIGAMLLCTLAFSVNSWAAAPTHRASVSRSTTHRVAAPPPAARTVPAQHLTLTVLWDDAMSSKESGLWIGYLFARMDYIGRNGRDYPQLAGVIAPKFDEEVFARSEASKVYRDMRSRGKGVDSKYFNDLEKVEAAGFMREYAWQYFKRSDWGAAPTSLRMSEFAAWNAVNLSNHQPQTRGRVAFQG